MAIRRIDMRIDKIDRDLKTMKDEKAKESSNEYKTKLEATRAELADDLKELAAVTGDGWNDYKEGVDEHLDRAKADIKPVML